jgi:NADPH:quinone reductase-like Zn-dependent oxidoreductase
MKAVVMRRRGGPEVLQVEEVPTPVPGPGEVLVRIYACGLNHLDLYTRAGAQGRKAKLPHILGLEPVGEIAALGEGVTGWQIGDRVLVGAFIVCGVCEFCRAGMDNLCRQRKIIGVDRWGGYAEHVVAPAANLMRLGSHISYEEAAAVQAAFGTAWHMLASRARIRPGETVLVLAAGSGIGTAAIQIARHFGCRVIAAASSKEKLEKARSLGADVLINYRQQPRFSLAVVEATGGRGADIVFEHVGSDTWKESVASLAFRGRLVFCGSTTGRWGETDLWGVFYKEAEILGSFGATRADFRAVMERVEQGIFRPVIDRVFHLEEAAEAHRYLEDRRVFGKVVLRIP